MSMWMVEQAKGIEPSFPAWKAGVLAVIRCLHEMGNHFPQKNLFFELGLIFLTQSPAWGIPSSNTRTDLHRLSLPAHQPSLSDMPPCSTPCI